MRPLGKGLPTEPVRLQQFKFVIAVAGILQDVRGGEKVPREPFVIQIRYLASTALDRAGQVLSVLASDLLETFHTRQVLSVTFLPDGRALVVGTVWGRVYLWRHIASL